MEQFGKLYQTENSYLFIHNDYTQSNYYRRRPFIEVYQSILSLEEDWLLLFFRNFEILYGVNVMEKVNYFRLKDRVIINLINLSP